MHPYIKRSKKQIAILGLIQALIQSAGLIILFTSNDAIADTGVDGNIAWSIDGDTLTLSVQSGQAGTDMNDYNASGNRPRWEGSSMWSNVTNVVIENGVSTIGSWAFLLCDMTSITIPNSVISIGERAFSDCYSLTSITIPNGITSIKHGLFYGCTSLTSITIPNSVTLVEHSSFYGCTSLTSITIPNSVTAIGEQAFVNCTSLASLIIPDSVTDISDVAFLNCTSLTKITFGTGLTNLGVHVFSVYVSDDYTWRNWYDFSGNSINLSDYNMVGKTFVGETWQNMYQMESGTEGTSARWDLYYDVDVGSTILHIMPVEGVQSAQLPNRTTSTRPSWESSSVWQDVLSQGHLTVRLTDITQIGQYDFYHFTGELIIYYDYNNSSDTTLTTIGTQAVQDTRLYNFIPYDYTSSINYVIFNNPNGVINPNAFSGTTSTDNFIIVADSIGSSAFWGSDLNRQDITCNTIGAGQFSSCTNLIRLEVKTGQSTFVIPDNFAVGCTSLSSLTLPDSTVSIGNYAFRETRLYPVYIPQTVTSIGTRQYYDMLDTSFVICYATVPPTISTPFSSQSTVVYVPSQSLQAYQQTQWNNYDLRGVEPTQIDVPSDIELSVYGGADISVAFVDTWEFYDYRLVRQVSADENIVSVQSLSMIDRAHFTLSIATHGVVGSAIITVYVYNVFYKTDITQTIDVNVIYNSESTVNVIEGYVYDYTITPSVTPQTITLYGNASSWVSVTEYTLHGIVPADISAQNDLVVVQRTSQPEQTQSWHITFVPMPSITVVIGDNATAEVYSNGNVIILGSGQTYADTLIPYANLIKMVDIRGLTTITDGTLPVLANEITLILGDSVHTYADSNNNVIENLILGKGLTDIPNGLILYDLSAQRITDISNALGHIFVKSDTNDSVLYQQDRATTQNRYNNATCYCVVGKSLNNSEQDRIMFMFEMARPVSEQTQAFITLSTHSWSVSQENFTDISIDQNGILQGTAISTAGTYSGNQTHNMVNNHYKNDAYKCTLSALSIQFTIFVEVELIIH